MMSGATEVMKQIHRNNTKRTIRTKVNPATAAVDRHQIESGLGGGLAYVGLSSKYDRNMSGSCKEIS